jgi:hypothetical protein
MGDIDTLLALFEDLSLEELEELHQFMRENQQQLLSQMRVRGKSDRVVALGKALSEARQRFAADHPEAINQDELFRQRRIAELISQLPKD